MICSCACVCVCVYLWFKSKSEVEAKVWVWINLISSNLIKLKKVICLKFAHSLICSYAQFMWPVSSYYSAYCLLHQRMVRSANGEMMMEKKKHLNRRGIKCQIGIHDLGHETTDRHARLIIFTSVIRLCLYRLVYIRCYSLLCLSSSIERLAVGDWQFRIAKRQLSQPLVPFVNIYLSIITSIIMMATIMLILRVKSTWPSNYYCWHRLRINNKYNHFFEKYLYIWCVCVCVCVVAVKRVAIGVARYTTPKYI